LISPPRGATFTQCLSETWSAAPTSPKHYRTLPPFIIPPSTPPEAPGLNSAVKSAMVKAGHPLTNYVFIVVNNSNVELPGRETPQPPYQNFVHAQGEALLCISNFADRDEMFGRPERLFWSDLVAACCFRGTSKYELSA
jgi:hypothetical protein